MAEPKNPVPDSVAKFAADVVESKTTGAPFPDVTLDELFVGAEYSGLRKQVERDGMGSYTDSRGEQQWLAVEVGENNRVMAVAAAIPRTPGRAEDFLRQVADFTEQTQTRRDEIALYNRIYEAEGLVNNATNVCASLVATKGGFKVRRVAGKPGKSGDSRAKELALLLQYWAENVNSDAEDAVVTGAQGIQDWIVQGVRQALIEGDHVARTHWVKATVPQLGGKKYSLPMNLQSFGGEEIEIPAELAGTSVELIYWVPPSTLLDAIKGTSKDKLVKDHIDKLIPSDVQTILKRDGKYPLDPKLMVHIKHRGVQKKPYGESFVKPAMSTVAYKRALQALDVVTIENLVQRMVIFKIGSEDVNSPYHAQAVVQRRALMLDNLLRRIGPSSHIIWAGPDLTAEDVGAHGQVMSLDGRFELVRTMMREDLGVPAALLTGEGSDGKASGIAGTRGVAAKLIELQNRYAKALTTIARRIAEANGYEDVDVVWEFAPSILHNHVEVLSAMQKGFQDGTLSTRTIITDGYGLDYEAEEGRQLEDVQKGYKDEPFGPPKSLLTTNAAGTAAGGGADGRPTNTGRQDPRSGRETGSAEENK